MSILTKNAHVFVICYDSSINFTCLDLRDMSLMPNLLKLSEYEMLLRYINIQIGGKYSLLNSPNTFIIRLVAHFVIITVKTVSRPTL